MDLQFQEPKKNWVLVHAEVTGQGPITGIRYGHAYLLEKKSFPEVSLIWDLVADRKDLPEVVYTAIGHIDRKKINGYFEYTYAEMREKMNEYNHWGPWDLVTEREGEPIPPKP